MTLAAIAPLLAAVAVSVKTDPQLPAKNLLPEGYCDFATNVVFSDNKKSVYRNIKNFVKPGRTYVLACDIKPSLEVSTSAAAVRAGLGCTLAYWNSDRTKTVAIYARGEGCGKWRHVVSDKVTMPDWIGTGPISEWKGLGQLTVGLAYSRGSGEVRNIELFEADCELIIEATSGDGIAQVKVVDDEKKTVFDTGVITDTPTIWKGRIMADTARNYVIYAIDTKGNIAVNKTGYCGVTLRSVEGALPAKLL